MAQGGEDVVCLQELKAEQGAFPIEAIIKAGYRAAWVGQKTWNGVAILSRRHEIHVTRGRLPGDPADRQSRYIEAAINGIIIACIYLPNGNPQPGPKFNYKLAWFERLIRHARALKKTGRRLRSLATSTSCRWILISIRPSPGTMMHSCSLRAGRHFSAF